MNYTHTPHHQKEPYQNYHIRELYMPLFLSLSPSIHHEERKRKINPGGNRTESRMKLIFVWNLLKMKQLLRGFLCCGGVVFHDDVCRCRM